MEEATFLTRFASKVTLIHRREQFRASKIMLDRARANPKIAFMTDTVVDDVLDIGKKEVTALRLRNLKSGESWDFPTSAMFLGIGHIPNAKAFRRPARNRRGWVSDHAQERLHEGCGSIRLRRCAGSPLPPGYYSSWLGLHGGARSGKISGRRRALSARSLGVHAKRLFVQRKTTSRVEGGSVSQAVRSTSRGAFFRIFIR